MPARAGARGARYVQRSPTGLAYPVPVRCTTMCSRMGSCRYCTDSIGTKPPGKRPFLRHYTQRFSGLITHQRTDMRMLVQIRPLSSTLTVCVAPVHAGARGSYGSADCGRCGALRDIDALCPDPRHARPVPRTGTHLGGGRHRHDALPDRRRRPRPPVPPVRLAHLRALYLAFLRHRWRADRRLAGAADATPLSPGHRRRYEAHR